MTAASYWPSPGQERVLQAAFAGEDAASAAWEALSGDPQSALADPWMRAFLPLAVRRGHSGGALAEAANAVRLSVWSRNLERLEALASVQAGLKKRSVPMLLLKGSAMLPHYGDIGLRGMGDFDFMVPPENLEEAAASLSADGWMAEAGMTPAEVALRTRVRHACHYHRDEQACDLHWRPVHRCHAPEVAAEFWNASEAVELRGMAVRVPCPTDLFFHACVHGAQWEPVPQARWVADALTLQHGPSPVDAQRLGRLAEMADLRVALSQALDYLKRAFGVDLGPIPCGDAADWELREQELRTKPGPLGWRDALAWHRFNFQRIRRVDPEWSGRQPLVAWAQYMKEFAGAKSWLEFARMAVRRGRSGGR